MATGAAARSVREGIILHASHFLMPSEAEGYTSEVPKLDWFNKQREALGLESYLYTFMRIAGCEKILQWGFDETSIDGHGLLNQWAIVQDWEGKRRRRACNDHSYPGVCRCITRL